MNVGKVFVFVAAATGVAAVVLVASQRAPQTAADATPLPPQKPASEPTDPSEVFKDQGPVVLFAPKQPELAFQEYSDGLPRGGTWRGYPLLFDFDGDGRADLVASNREEDGYGVWKAPAKGPWVRCIGGPKKDDEGLPRDMGYGPARAADVDGDGRPDLLLSAHKDALRIYRNVPAIDETGKSVDDGQLHWKAADGHIENPFLMLDIAVGNIDGDANADIVGVGHFKGGFGVYLGDGKGGMRRLAECAQIPSPKTFGQRIELGDVDGDGLDDIVATTKEGLRVLITHKGDPFTWEERSAGLPSPKIGNSIDGLCVARFRGGAHPEVAACMVPDPMLKPGEVDSIGVFGWNAETKRWEHVDKGLPRGEAYRELGCADMNGDGNVDLIAFSLQSGAVVYLGDGKGGFTPHGRLPGIFGIGRLAIGDIDGDKLPDLALSLPATKEHPDGGGLRALLNRRELWK